MVTNRPGGARTNNSFRQQPGLIKRQRNKNMFFLIDFYFEKKSKSLLTVTQTKMKMQWILTFSFFI